MLQGIEGHGFYGNCVVPIIENTARECELTDRMRQAIKDYPHANAVLVRRHGEQPKQACVQQSPAGYSQQLQWLVQACLCSDILHTPGAALADVLWRRTCIKYVNTQFFCM